MQVRFFYGYRFLLCFKERMQVVAGIRRPAWACRKGSPAPVCNDFPAGRQPVGGFHPFGLHQQLQAFGQRDDGLDNGDIALFGGKVLDKGAVDLELVNRQMLKPAQRRVAGAKIINGQAYTGFTQAVQQLYGLVGIVHH